LREPTADEVIAFVEEALKGRWAKDDRADPYRQAVAVTALEICYEALAVAYPEDLVSALMADRMLEGQDIDAGLRALTEGDQ
jgi:hypothetical protein